MSTKVEKDVSPEFTVRDQCGLANNRVATQGVLLEMPDGREIGVYYGMFVSGPKYHPSELAVRFRYEDDEGRWEVAIPGFENGASRRALRQINRHMTWGMRQSIHVLDEVVKDIVITKIAERSEAEA